MVHVIILLHKKRQSFVFFYDILSEVEGRMYKIVKKEVLNDVVQLMEVHAPMVARKCEPGQFIILRVGEDGERIPLTIADYDREKETITIIYQIVGYSTKQLAKLEEACEQGYDVVVGSRNQSKEDSMAQV